MHCSVHIRPGGPHRPARRLLRRVAACACALALLVAMMAGCAAAKDALTLIQSDLGIDPADATVRLQVQYVANARGSKLPVAELGAQDALFSRFVDLLRNARQTRLDKNTNYCPPLEASHTLVFYAGQSQATFYYDSAKNLWTLVRPYIRDGKDYIEYLYFETATRPGALLDALAASARAESPREESFDVSALLLRASISVEELEKEGEQVSYQVFWPVSPHWEDGFYVMGAQESGLEDGQLLVVVAPPDLDDAVSVDINTIERTDYYIKVTFSQTSMPQSLYPDDGFELLAPRAAVTVSKADFPEDRIIVFMDDQGSIRAVYKQRNE